MTSRNLCDFGYSSDLTARSRHSALNKAVDVRGYRAVIGNLTLSANRLYSKSPEVADIFKQDQQWLSNKYRLKKLESVHPRYVAKGKNFIRYAWTFESFYKICSNLRMLLYQIRYDNSEDDKMRYIRELWKFIHFLTSSIKDPEMPKFYEDHQKLQKLIKKIDKYYEPELLEIRCWDMEVMKNEKDEMIRIQQLLHQLKKDILEFTEQPWIRRRSKPDKVFEDESIEDEDL